MYLRFIVNRGHSNVSLTSHNNWGGHLHHWLSGEFIEHETKFLGVKSYLPFPTYAHEAPLVVGGESPKRDLAWSLVSTAAKE